MRAPTHALARDRRARLAGAVVLAGMAIALGLPSGAPTGDAADRFVAGGPAVERTVLGGDRAAPGLALAAAFRSRLGLPEPAATRVERVVDRFAGTTYDEVTGSDATGHAIHLQRFDVRGRLVAAVIFGWQTAGSAPLANTAAARSRASRLAADLGVDTAGTPDVREAPDNTGWTLTWSRVVDNVPVVGDGVRLDLWPDGRLHAVVRTERALAPRPETILPEAAARVSRGGNAGDDVRQSLRRSPDLQPGPQLGCAQQRLRPCRTRRSRRDAPPRVGRGGAHLRHARGIPSSRQAVRRRGHRRPHRRRRPPMILTPPDRHAMLRPALGWAKRPPAAGPGSWLALALRRPSLPGAPA